MHRPAYAGPVTGPTSEGDLASAAELFRVLSSPVRLAVLDRLAAGPLCVHEIVTALGVSQPLVSQHLRVLRDADLVRVSRRGREATYALADHHVAHLVADAVAHGGEPEGPAGTSVGTPP